MRIVVTSKYQATIPKKIREQAGIAVHDVLERGLLTSFGSRYPFSASFRPFF